LYEICRKEFIEAFGWSIEDLPTGVGMSMVVATADSKIVMHTRSQTVDFPGITALPGGILDQDSPFDHVEKELWEELGIERDEVRRMLLLGISRRFEQRISNELNFFVEVSLSSDEINQRQPNVQDKEGEIFFLDCEAHAVHNLIRENHESMTPGQVFCFVQAGRYLWGREWSELGAE
jgi:8-oxo-dGTP pyrophosphatase MutT (NUDIX family)